SVALLRGAPECCRRLRALHSSFVRQPKAAPSARRHCEYFRNASPGCLRLRVTRLRSVVVRSLRRIIGRLGLVGARLVACRRKYQQRAQHKNSNAKSHTAILLRSATIIGVSGAKVQLTTVQVFWCNRAL